MGVKGRTYLALAAVAYFYLYGTVRTTRFGFSFREWLFLFACAVSAFVLVAMAARREVSDRMVLAFAALAFCLTVFGEAYAGAQEWRTVRMHGRECPVGMEIPRWPPFSDHEIRCAGSGKWTGERG